MARTPFGPNLPDGVPHERRSDLSFSTAQLDYIDKHAQEVSKRSAKDAVRAFFVRVAIGYAILVGGLVWAISDKPSVDRLNAASTGICNRLNDARAQSNVSDAVSFGILTSSAQRERALARTKSADDRDPEIHTRSARALEAQAKRLTVIPLTDCSEAIQDPQGYRNPTAGPIGDVRTGEINPQSARIIEQSERRLSDSGDAFRG